MQYDIILQDVPYPPCAIGANITLICGTLSRNRSKKRAVRQSWVPALHFARPCCVDAEMKLSDKLICLLSYLSAPAPRLPALHCSVVSSGGPNTTHRLLQLDADLGPETWSVSLGPEWCSSSEWVLRVTGRAVGLPVTEVPLCSSAFTRARER